jgi:cobalt/nickel transport system permease protein
MGTGHAHALYRPGMTAVHRLAPEIKITAAVVSTLAVVLTPRAAFGAFAIYAALIAVVAALARVSPGWLARRALIEAPFVVFALILPVAGAGSRVDVLGFALSVDGLYAGWNILVKGTLGVLISLLLAATTTPRDLIVGLDRLRCPQLLVQIATFMLRYLQVLGDEARRMRIARLSRGYEPRFLWQARSLAAGVGALFLRAYERGERVYLAMLSRGYTGRLPELGAAGTATVAQWITGLAVPALAAAVAVTAAL